MVSVDGDFLVGVIVGIVCEHLERENTALSPEVETAVRVKSWRLSSDREHGSLTGFLLVSSRVSFHALRKTWTGVKRWWMVVKKGGRADETGGKSEYLHGLILAVGAQVDWWAVSELDHDAILPRIILRWRQICSPQTSSRSLQSVQTSQTAQSLYSALCFCPFDHERGLFQLSASGALFSECVVLLEKGLHELIYWLLSWSIN